MEEINKIRPNELPFEVFTDFRLGGAEVEDRPRSILRPSPVSGLLQGADGKCCSGLSARAPGFPGGRVGVRVGPGLRSFQLPPQWPRLGSCQGPDGSEGGRARGLGLGSEVLFSRQRAGTGLALTLQPGGSPRIRWGGLLPSQVRSELRGEFPGVKGSWGSLPPRAGGL